MIATVGMKKPKQEIPFIPLEQLIDGNGEKLLTELVYNHELNLVPKEKNNMVVQTLCEESLRKFLTYLNPSKVLSVLLEFDSILEKTLGQTFSNPIRVRLIVHCGCALERVVTRNQLVYKGDRSQIDTQKLYAIKKAASVFEKSLKLRFDEDEFCFMANMI